MLVWNLDFKVKRRWAFSQGILRHMHRIASRVYASQEVCFYRSLTNHDSLVDVVGGVVVGVVVVSDLVSVVVVIMGVVVDGLVVDLVVDFVVNDGLVVNVVVDLVVHIVVVVRHLVGVVVALMSAVMVRGVLVVDVVLSVVRVVTVVVVSVVGGLAVMVVSVVRVVSVMVGVTVVRGVVVVLLLVVVVDGVVGVTVVGSGVVVLLFLVVVMDSMVSITVVSGAVVILLLVVVVSGVVSLIRGDIVMGEIAALVVSVVSGVVDTDVVMLGVVVIVVRPVVVVLLLVVVMDGVVGISVVSGRVVVIVMDGVVGITVVSGGVVVIVVDGVGITVVGRRVVVVMEGGVVLVTVVGAGVVIVVVDGVVSVVVVDSWGVMAQSVLVQGVLGDAVLHLTTKEDLGESETDGVTELIEVLVLPLSLSVHDLVVHILAVHDEIVLDVEDEVPRISESLGHLSELVKISANGSLALLELVSNVVNNMAEVFDGVQDRVEAGVLDLVNDTAKALPDVLSITEALNTVRNLSLNRAGKQTLKDLAHSEESEVNVRALHGLEVVHLLILLVIDLIKKLLPVVVEVVEEFLMVDHLGLSVEEHGGGLTEVLTSVEPLAHAVVMETLTSVLEDVNSIDNERLSGLKEDLLGVKEGLSHSLDLLVIVVIDLAAVIEHVADVGHGQTELVDGLGGLLVGSVPEAAHGVLEVLLDGVGVRDAVGNIRHSVEVEGSDEEALDESGDLMVVVCVSSDGDSGNKSGGERGLEHSSLKVLY